MLRTEGHRTTICPIMKQRKDFEDAGKRHWKSNQNHKISKIGRLMRTFLIVGVILGWKATSQKLSPTALHPITTLLTPSPAAKQAFHVNKWKGRPPFVRTSLASKSPAATSQKGEKGREEGDTIPGRPTPSEIATCNKILQIPSYLLIRSGWPEYWEPMICCAMERVMWWRRRKCQQLNCSIHGT